jgi:type IV secretion system protein VirB4
MNCAVVFATQSLSDFTSDEKTFSNILEACATKIFLPNQNAMQKGTDKLIGLYELYKSFGLNDAQIHIIQNAIPKREYFISTKLGSRLISFELEEIAKAFCCAGIDKVPYIKKIIQDNSSNWQQTYINQINA